MWWWLLYVTPGHNLHVSRMSELTSLAVAWFPWLPSNAQRAERVPCPARSLIGEGDERRASSNSLLGRFNFATSRISSNGLYLHAVYIRYAFSK